MRYQIHCQLFLLGVGLLSSCFLSEAGSHTQLVKTECLAVDEELSSFHCLSVRDADRLVPCIDTKEDECPNWAAQGECTKNPQFMLLQCRKSCNSCIDLQQQGGVVQVAPHRENRSSILEHLVETQVYQHDLAHQSVEYLTTCVNKHELCTHWSLEGECKANPHFMYTECPAACRTC